MLTKRQQAFLASFNTADIFLLSLASNGAIELSTRTYDSEIIVLFMMVHYDLLEIIPRLKPRQIQLLITEAGREALNMVQRGSLTPVKPG